METLWPWMAVAGVGALHGLNPATGWLFATACGVKSRDRMRVLHALLPIALAHIAAITLVAVAFTRGLALGRSYLIGLAGGLLLILLAVHVHSHFAQGRQPPAAHKPPALQPAGLALWSFMVSTAHGAGLMLLPALMPICAGDTLAQAAIEPDLLPPALAAVAVHTAAMLATTGALASLAYRGFDGAPRWYRRLGERRNRKARAQERQDIAATEPDRKNVLREPAKFPMMEPAGPPM